MASTKTTKNGAAPKAAKAPAVFTDTKGARRLRCKSTHPLANASPRGDRVIVLRDKEIDETPAGILIARTHGSGAKKQTGTVIAVGPGSVSDGGVRVPVDLNPGDRVILVGYAGLEINETPLQTDEELVLLRQDDVTAVLDVDYAG